MLSAAVPSIATLWICRWVWRGSTLAKYVALVWAALAIIIFVALAVFQYAPSPPLMAIPVISAIVWLWFACTLVVSPQVQTTLKEHWAQLKKENRTPPYFPIFLKGTVTGAILGCLLVGSLIAQRYYNTNIAMQNWLDQVAVEVNKKAPMLIEDWLTFTRLDSSSLSFTYYYEIRNLETGVTIEDVKQHLIQNAPQSDCDNDMMKDLISKNIPIVRRYTIIETNETFDLSISDYCKRPVS